MNLCTRVIPQSLLEINKIEINEKTLQLPKPSVTGSLDLQIKSEKIFLPYHILQKISNLQKSLTSNTQI